MTFESVYQFPLFRKAMRGKVKVNLSQHQYDHKGLLLRFKLELFIIFMRSTLDLTQNVGICMEYRVIGASVSLVQFLSLFRITPG